MQQKTVLFLLQKPPYLNDRVFEAFDALLVAAAFEQNVRVLFRGAGVQQLLNQQAPSGQRSVAKILGSLATYEVDAIYADRTDCDRFGLKPEAFVLEPTLLEPAAVAQLIASCDVVLND